MKAVLFGLMCSLSASFALAQNINADSFLSNAATIQSALAQVNAKEVSAKLTQNVFKFEVRFDEKEACLAAQKTFTTKFITPGVNYDFKCDRKNPSIGMKKTTNR